MRAFLDRFNSHNEGDDMADAFAPAFETIRKATGEGPRPAWKGKDKRKARRAAISGKQGYLSAALSNRDD